MVAPLIQMFDDNKLESMESDIGRNKYYIDYVPYNNRSEDGHACITFFGDDHPDYSYEIIFTYGPRFEGYCQCTPEDDGFRPDKGCCGISCDWYAPVIYIRKVEDIINYEWNGDQSSYWDMEKKIEEEMRGGD